MMLLASWRSVECSVYTRGSSQACASKVSNRIRYMASSCGALAVASRKALTLVGIEEEEEGQGTAKWAKGTF